MKSKVVASLSLALLLLIAACRRSEPSSASGAPQRHTLKGVIQSVDPAGPSVVVSHEAVPDYMGAMTMSFPIKDDPSVIAILRPGDKIQATLVVDGSRYWLEKILTTGFVAGQAGAAPVASNSSASSASSASAAATPAPNRALSPGDAVPDFSLTDQAGRRVSLSEFRGQPVAVTFIYTRCPIATACPMTTAKFSRLDAMLAKEKFGQLFTLTLDPVYDTQKVLAEYAHKAGADEKRWKFLTGTPRAIAEVASRFGILYTSDHGQLIHGQGVGVVDSDGKLSTIYYGNDWQPESIFRDLEKARAAGVS